MKKLLLLLLCAGTFFTTFAQNREDAKRVILGGSKNGKNRGNTTDNPKDVILGGGNSGTYPYPNTYPSGSSRNQQVDQINREYDLKIQSVRNNPYLTPAEKERAIRQLNIDRARRIREVNGTYGRNDDRRYKHGKHRGHEDEDDDDNDEYEHNHHEGHHDNGRHLGWEKGRGNPHRNGGKWNDD